MRSCIYHGWVWHRRRIPRRHEFTYPAFVFCLALDELGALHERLRLWSWNAHNLFAFFDRDHFDRLGEGADVAIRRFLSNRGVDHDGCRIFLLTHCRLLGYVFNPVSFFLCVPAHGTPSAVVAEVNNTFGERHLYLLSEHQTSSRVRRYSASKEMHVSPFVSMAAEYDFRFEPIDQHLSVTILERERGEPVLDARLWGERRELTDRTLWNLAWRYPLMTIRVMGAIHWEALRLWGKGLRVHRQPRPSEAQQRQQLEMRESHQPHKS